jgi:DNA-binding beta-propeller fold protein YncE
LSHVGRSRPGTGPSAIAITPNGKVAYVTRDSLPSRGDFPGEVIPIGTATNTAGKAIPVGINPGDAAPRMRQQWQRRQSDLGCG